jgi:hypothetical protein
MRAIETRYKGRLFRSRLEARYAVLFDELAIAWDYEPEGYVFEDGTRYLPDFWLKIPGKPGQGYWVEVKASDPTPAEVHKLSLLVSKSGHQGWFFTGSPGEGSTHSHDGKACGPLRWAAPIVACATRDLNGRWRQAAHEALGARFEFAKRRRA